MSGVRVVNPELKAVGLTLPGFVERGRVIASMPSLGLLTIAGATPRHWHVDYVDIDDLDESAIQAWIDMRPDLVAVSSLTARINDAYQVLAMFRTAGICTAVGGLHASVLPSEAMEHADVVVRGQGEWIWPQVIRDFEANELQRIYDGMHVQMLLDEAPMPRYDLLDPQRYNRISLQTTRGCPLDCKFCAASRLISPYKRKSISRIRSELTSILAIWDKPFIELADDNTFVNKAWSRELAELMAEFPQVRWFTETDISISQDRELLELLSNSGCAQVLIGLESVSTGSLSETDRGQWKKRQHSEYAERIKEIQDSGISVNGCFVFGFDHDTPDIFEKTWEFIQESGLSEVQATVLTPFPGTSLEAQLRQEGRLIRNEYWDQCTLFDVTFRPNHFGISELESGFKELVQTVYSKEATERRTHHRRRIYRSRPSMVAGQ